MFKLPALLPEKLRKQLEKVLSSPEESLPEVARILLEATGAEDAVLYISIDSRRLSKVITRRKNTPEDFNSSFLHNWQASGIHQSLSSDLSERLSPRTFSSFSWPYPYIQNADSKPDKRIYVMPKDFSLLIPFSSELVVSSENDSSFFGYLTFVFDDMPELANDLLQMIITLSPLISDMVAALIREEERTKSKVALYAHEVKRNLLVQREILRGVDADNRSSQAFGRLDRVLKRMLITTNSILLAERKGELQLSPMTLSVNELVHEAVEEMSSLFDSAGLELSLALDEDIVDSSLDPAIFPGAIFNLLDNALKYAADWVSVKTFVKGKSTVCLEISNGGEGILVEEEEYLFSKHFRGSNSRTLSGNGLGLYLVKKIVEAHGGTVTFNKLPSCFSLELPGLASLD